MIKPRLIMRSCLHLLGMIGVALIVSNCQYDPDRVSDGDANPVIVEYRKIYSASKSIGPDSTLTLLDQFLANKEFINLAGFKNKMQFVKGINPSYLISGISGPALEHSL